jgi:hypothetical protein
VSPERRWQRAGAGRRGASPYQAVENMGDPPGLGNTAEKTQLYRP